MSDAAQTTPAPSPAPTADYPEFWLGQIAMISDMERKGTLTRAQMVSEVHRVVKEIRWHDRDKRMRALHR